MQDSRRLSVLAPLAMVLAGVALMGQGCLSIFGYGDEILPPPPMSIDTVANFETFPDIRDENAPTDCKDLPTAMLKIDYDYDKDVAQRREAFENKKAALEKGLEECRNLLIGENKIGEPGSRDTGYFYGDSCRKAWQDVQEQYPRAQNEAAAGIANGPELQKYEQLKAEYKKCSSYRHTLYDCIDDYQKGLYEAQKAYRGDVDTATQGYNADLGAFTKKEQACLKPGAKPIAKVDTSAPTVAQTPPNTVLPPNQSAPTPNTTMPSKGKYYAVPAGKTGKDICAAAGKTCVGYTSRSVDTCMMFHPGAIPSFTFDGSKSPYYCDGAPQGGICGKLANACNICEACNVNENCDTQIGEWAREAFVECS